MRDNEANGLNEPQNKDGQSSLNKLILHPSFLETIENIRKVNIRVTEPPKESSFDFSGATFPPNGKLRLVEQLGAYNLSAKKGLEVSKTHYFAGYDESKLKYVALEGSAFFTSHSLVVATKQEYLPVSYLSFYFYSRSKDITDISSVFRHSLDHVADANYDYVKDRSDFLNKWAVENTILFIDGPLIGGNMTQYTLNLVEDLHERNIIPIFFVKNSDSNLVTEAIPELQNRFNSDMHWTYNHLQKGQRTNFFLYEDEYNFNNAKVFCYLKAFDLSPQRIEFHTKTYLQHQEKIGDLMDLIYYLLLVHGDKKNPQLRPIAIAEKFAREVLKVSDSFNLIKNSGLMPTMNQERFGN
ncbi:DNA double-strand break repair nuclease NurA [Mucilaginibacter sp. RS28]|uniref:DNA double-strand break repair nuclease NurA n=1 Tax=Mucilaginibacter straminoryzae TaxID=2932774 RepID=A0A9X1X410_9SPHI|nr:DNA double-strand break repair nuclease NurA [Mucilaginibacter straminoryzae]MCJ8208069.1 DNA double-strand break repair nuclease NurA [Mucilaginibacter straminoryzae]